MRGITVINKKGKQNFRSFYTQRNYLITTVFFFCLHKVVRYLEQRKAQSLFDTSHKGLLVFVLLILV